MVQPGDGTRDILAERRHLPPHLMVKDGHGTREAPLDDREEDETDTKDA
jgi:hypothetical protein